MFTTPSLGMRRLIFWITGLLCPVALTLGWWLSPWWELLLLLPAALWLWASLVPKCSWWGPQMREFPTRKREALITFDNAPHPVETPLVLDLLKAEGAKGLFFLTGVQAMRYPEIVKQIVADGHGLGLHGMSYQPSRFWWRSPGRIRSEVETAVGVVRQILPDYKVAWFRAPGGRRGPWLHPVLATYEMQLMLWSADDGAPGVRDFETSVIRMRRDIQQGAIIALHHGHQDREGEPVVPDLVRELLLWLRGQGYKLGED
jgi:peptidoglycan/xylan/chitin deacetylase (PgdA/CDA1 family)